MQIRSIPWRVITIGVLSACTDGSDKADNVEADVTYSLSILSPAPDSEFEEGAVVEPALGRISPWTK